MNTQKTWKRYSMDSEYPVIKGIKKVELPDDFHYSVVEVLKKYSKKTKVLSLDKEYPSEPTPNREQQELINKTLAEDTGEPFASKYMI